MAEKSALLNKIERQDRRYRVALFIFMLSTAVAVSVLAGYQIKTNSKVDRQLTLQGQILDQQSRTLKELKKSTDTTNANTDAQLSKVSKQIDCIAAFFTQRDRTSAVITNLQQCQIVRPDGSIVPINPSQAQPAAGSKSPQSSGQSPSNGQQPSNNSTPSPTPEQPPVKVLGIPVCVPFTGVCAR